MSTTLLEIRHLTLRNATTGQTLVDNLNLSIPSGKRVALVGESGSGKSLTALSIPALLPSTITPDPSTEIIWKGHTALHQLSTSERRKYRGREMGFIFQDPLHALDPVMTIGAQFLEVLARHHVTSEKIALKTTAIERLKEVELPTPETLLDAYPCHLSGGQQQRVMIAMAMSARPTLLIADEPTTALDPLTQHTILALIDRIRAQHGTSLLLISHDLRLVERWADEVVVLEHGHVREQGEVSTVFRAPQNNYTQRLIAACPNRLNVLERRLHEHAANDHATKDTLPPILTLENTEVSVQGGHSKKREAFHLAPLNLTFNEQCSIGIIGGSGSGKTTLAKLLMGLLIPTAGTLCYRGTDSKYLNAKQLKQRRRDVQMIFQNPYASLNPAWSIESILSEPLDLMGIHYSSAQKKEQLCRMLEQVELDSDAAMLKRYPGDFSGGQRQRLALARALLLEPRLLVCDEATSALDVSVQAEVVKLLKRLQKEHGLGLVVIAHDLAMVAELADEVIVMHQGHLIEQGNVHHVLTHPKHPITQELCAA